MTLGNGRLIPATPPTEYGSASATKQFAPRPPVDGGAAARPLDDLRVPLS